MHVTAQGVTNMYVYMCKEENYRLEGVKKREIKTETEIEKGVGQEREEVIYRETNSRRAHMGEIQTHLSGIVQELGQPNGIGCSALGKQQVFWYLSSSVVRLRNVSLIEKKGGKKKANTNK